MVDDTEPKEACFTQDNEPDAGINDHLQQLNSGRGTGNGDNKGEEEEQEELDWQGEVRSPPKKKTKKSKKNKKDSRKERK